VNAIEIETIEVDVHGHLVLPGGAYGWLTVILWAILDISIARYTHTAWSC